MSKKKKPVKDRNKDAVAKAKAKQVENLPMNKHFLNAKDEDGNDKYPIVSKLIKYKYLDYERVYDIMRQISAYVAQVRHHQNRIKRLTEQYNGEVVEHDEFGRKYKREEIQLMIISEKIAIPRDIAKIREYCVDKLLPLIDEVRFSGEQYNQYILSVNKSVTELGYELFPQSLELIFPDFE